MGTNKRKGGSSAKGLSFAQILENEKQIAKRKSEAMCPIFMEALGSIVPDGETLAQADVARKLNGMKGVFLFPDAHPGKGIPIGAVCVSQTVFHPHLAGSDVGCGVSLWKFDIGGRLDPESLAKRISTSEPAPFKMTDSERAELESISKKYPIGVKYLGGGLGRSGLGTTGGGNHFAEIQSVISATEQCPISNGQLVLMVHTGSRGLGDALSWKLGSADPLNYDSEDGKAWFDAHNLCLEWGALNRRVCARRLGDLFNIEPELIVDVWHNGIEKVTPISFPEWAVPEEGDLFIHRKGAARVSGDPFIPLPASRGEASFLLSAGDSTSFAWSCAHGAGRKWRRADCKKRLQERFSIQELSRPKDGGVVLCSNPDLIWEEAPQAYKSGAKAVEALLESGIATSISCRFNPLITIK